MADSVIVAKTLSIRGCGYDEKWLQKKIAEDPSILGFGNLELVDSERHQSRGGRLDFLLKNADDDTMYEVEVMLGTTDETHIVRTLEYWDLESRRWPDRAHRAVLVAETINRRFFNVIRLLSDTVPMIAIQANLIEADGKKILHFTTVLDAYEEPEDQLPSDGGVFDEGYWRSRSNSTLETAKVLLAVVSTAYDKIEPSYTKSYIALRSNRSQFWLEPSRSKTWVTFYVSEPDGDAVSSAFDQGSIDYEKKSTKDGARFVLKIDGEEIKAKAESFRRIVQFVKNWCDV
jgi:hypothetical protein